MGLRVGVVVALALCALSWAARAQLGYDRHGGDFLHFDVKSGDPAVCAARCERDARCRAWSFSYPRTRGTLATCALKNKVMPRTEDSCCVSGVRGAGVIEPTRGAVEYSIDRTGGDYRTVEMAAPDPAGEPCRAACAADAKCRAWTYVRPGYGSLAPRCFLKDKITRPRKKPCCISGVER